MHDYGRDHPSVSLDRKRERGSKESEAQPNETLLYRNSCTEDPKGENTENFLREVIRGSQCLTGRRVERTEGTHGPDGVPTPV